MSFRLEFDTDNAAFTDPDHPLENLEMQEWAKVEECERILREVERKLSVQQDGLVFDINGNPVGRWELT